MDTLEVIDLYLCAPVLYSKPSVAKQFQKKGELLGVKIIQSGGILMLWRLLQK